MWSDLFLALGGVLNWDNGDALITHSANLLTFSGATSGYTFNNGPIIVGSGQHIVLPELSTLPTAIASSAILFCTNVTTPNTIGAVFEGGYTTGIPGSWQMAVLHTDQLRGPSPQVLQATLVYFTTNVVATDTFTISDGTTTEVWTFVAGVPAAFQIQVGGTIAVTLQNMATAISGDSTLWDGVYSTTNVHTNQGSLVIHRIAQPVAGADRIFGSFASASTKRYVNLSQSVDYRGAQETSFDVEIPVADPATKTFGPGRLDSTLWNGDTFPSILDQKQHAVRFGTGWVEVSNATHTGDVTGASALTIAADAVTNAKLANMAQALIKGRASGAGTGDPTDLTATQARTILNVEDGADVTDATNVDAAGAVMDSDISESEGFLRKTGAGAYEAIKSNLGATTDPGATDDSAAGYGISSVWINVTLDKVWKCVDATAGAAVWKDLSAGGLTSIDTGNTLWVDGVNGSDPGTVGRQDLPWATIGAALTAASSGDLILVRPGSYPETGLTVGGNRTLRSTGGPTVTDIGGTGATATGIRVTVTFGSVLDGFTITLPTDATAAVHCAHGGTTNSTLSNVTFEGNGVTGLGLVLDTAGNMVVTNLRYESGDCDAIIDATAGVLQIDGMHVPLSGAVAVGIRLSGGAEAQVNNLVMESTTVTTGVRVSDATLGAGAIDLSGMTNAIRISDNAAVVHVVSGILAASTYNLLVDPALTGATGVVRLSVHMDPKFSIPNTWFDSDHAWTFFTKSDATEDASNQLWGAKQVIGHPEFGSGWSAGEGASYSTNNTVFTSNVTASPTADGGGLTDVSVAAESKTGSTYTFQGVTGGATGFSILWCTNRVDSSAAQLKFWGVEIDQVDAAVLSGGSFIWEIRTAANTWTEVQVMAVSQAEQYRYANAIFLRAASSETIRVGIDSDTTWPVGTITGPGGPVTGQWMRVRIAATITTAPTFERMRLQPSLVGVNAKGQLAAQGLAQWKATIVGSGLQWSGSGLGNGTEAVGTGGGAWTHELDKGLLNSAGDELSMQLLIPDGICTAYPITIRLIYGYHAFSLAPTLEGRSLVVEREGLLVADTAGGGITPIARTEALTDTVNAVAGLIQALVPTTTLPAKVFTLEYGPLDISDYYAGDMVLFNLEMTADGGGTDVLVWGIEVSGVAFAPGDVL
jgi:hypothetical protein